MDDDPLLALFAQWRSDIDAEPIPPLCLDLDAEPEPAPRRQCRNPRRGPDAAGSR